MKCTGAQSTRCGNRSPKNEAVIDGVYLEALRHHRADLFLQFATWETKAVCKIHDRMFVVQNGKPLGMRHLESGPR
jgi:hypothetical protein